MRREGWLEFFSHLHLSQGTARALDPFTSQLSTTEGLTPCDGCAVFSLALGSASPCAMPGQAAAGPRSQGDTGSGDMSGTEPPGSSALHRALNALGNSTLGLMCCPLQSASP